ncbi:MAG: hypothetical protein ACE5DX_00505 [Candidatus Dojkabacteria bacterium]
MALYELTFGISLRDRILQDGGDTDIRIGGTSYTTACNLRTHNGSVRQIDAIVPIGVTSESDDESFDAAVNRIFDKLTQATEGVVLRATTYSDTHTPVSLNLVSGGHRSMVMIEGCKNRGIVMPEIPPNNGQALIVVDTYELATPDSTYAGAVKMLAARDPDTFVTIGLGSTFVIPSARENLQEIADVSRNLCMSGNAGEVECLLETFGFDEVEQLMQALGVRILLRTYGKEGAQILYNFGEVIVASTYALPEDEKYDGNTTNAGDMFLAACLHALSTMEYESTEPESQLTEVLAFASRTTQKLLVERGT